MQNRIVKLNTKLAPDFLPIVELYYFCLNVVKFDLAAGPLGYRFDFAVDVPDTHTGRSFALHWAQFYPPNMPQSEVVRNIYATIYNVLVHELCEAWRVDGERPDNPHGELGQYSIYKTERYLEREIANREKEVSK